VPEAEQARCVALPRPSTSGKVAALLLGVLMTHHAPALVNNKSSGVSVMLRGKDHTSLAAAYRLFSRAPGAVMVLAAAVRAHVVAVGYAVVDARMAVVAVSGGGETAAAVAVVVVPRQRRLLLLQALLQSRWRLQQMVVLAAGAAVPTQRTTTLWTSC